MSTRVETAREVGAVAGLAGRAYVSRSQAQQVWDYVRTDWAARVGLLLIVLVVAAGTLAPWLTPRDPLEQSSAGLTAIGEPVAPGTAGYLLGTDPLGRDVASRLAYGARTSLVIGVTATF